MSFEANYLSPQQVRFSRSETGALAMSYDGKVHASVRIYMAYPLAEEGKLVSVRDALDENQREIGIIPDATQLEPESRRLIQEELAWRYFTPRISKIISLKEEG